MLVPNYIFNPNPTSLDIDTNFKENTEHGDSKFPVAIHYTSHDGTSLNAIHKHWHNEFEILIIVTGQVTVTIEENAIIATAGDIFFIPANQVHEANCFSNIPCSFFAIVFNPAFIESKQNDIITENFLSPFLNFPAQHIAYISKKEIFSTQFNHVLTKLIDSFALKEIGYELETKAWLLLFLKQIIAYKDYLFFLEIHQPDRHDISLTIKKTLNYIDQNYQSSISLQDISSNVGFSKEHFCRFFKKHFHMSFNAYLLHIRLKKAKNLLLFSDLKILDIAFAVGFESAAYFSTIFKREVGQTPKDFRDKPKVIDFI
ncbi:AraC family transcriptional regulator [Streptococcus sp. S784/96/1]|uniref:AraC family transcriptional regulator n=1 Tax=Streptococcus sp. S784/96/1 TaxID=2653499 RepID=UPI001386C4F0|nr:helix-turn-helix domain-containing protein [Streptococcus sp. S784/96/1]